jgi:hypothetical protein
MGNRFNMGGALDSALSCVLPIGDCLLWETGFRVVMGYKFWLGRSGLSKLGFQDLRNTLMIRLACTL